MCGMDEGGFFKPNDERALMLMDRAAQDVMQIHQGVPGVLCAAAEVTAEIEYMYVCT
jgi:hypothetical protein